MWWFSTKTCRKVHFHGFDLGLGPWISPFTTCMLFLGEILPPSSSKPWVGANVHDFTIEWSRRWRKSMKTSKSWRKREGKWMIFGFTFKNTSRWLRFRVHGVFYDPFSGEFRGSWREEERIERKWSEGVWERKRWSGWVKLINDLGKWCIGKRRRVFGEGSPTLEWREGLPLLNFIKL